MTFTLSKGERIRLAAWRRGDFRARCEDGHLWCERCGACACATDLGPEFPKGVLRVTTDKQGRTFCRECRYQQDNLGNW